MVWDPNGERLAAVIRGKNLRDIRKDGAGGWGTCTQCLHAVNKS